MKEKLIEQKIKLWFKKKGKKIKLSDNVLRENIIDSFDLIDLMIYLEKEFKIKFHPTDYENPNFTVIKNLIKIIKKYHDKLQS